MDRTTSRHTGRLTLVSAPLLLALALALGFATGLAVDRFGPFARAAGAPQAPVAAPAPVYASDLGTEHDPFVIENSQPRHAPLPPAAGDVPQAPAAVPAGPPAEEWCGQPTAEHATGSSAVGCYYR